MPETTDKPYGKLYLRYLNGHDWEVIRPFWFRSALLKRTVRVPAKFITDFHSIPRLFWRVLPPTEYGEAGVVHDWGYRTGNLTRKESDQVFKEALLACGAPAWKANIMYLAVRNFASGAYQGPQKD